MGEEDLEVFPALGMWDRVEGLKASPECGSLDELAWGRGKDGSPWRCARDLPWNRTCEHTCMAASSTPDASGWREVNSAKASSSQAWRSSPLTQNGENGDGPEQLRSGEAQGKGQ